MISKLGHLARACPHVSLESIEWKTDTTVAAIPYGLLIRTFDLEETVRENACLAPMINFTKTGSGQNMGKVEQRERERGAFFAGTPRW